jgi:hypothetical protein
VSSGYAATTSGIGSLAYLFTQDSRSTGIFSLSGDAQRSLLLARRESALSSGSSHDLSLDGTGSTNLLIPTGNNRQWTARVRTSAFTSAVSGTTLILGDSYTAEYSLLFKKVGGVSSLVGVNSSNIIADANMIDASFSFSAGTSQELKITFNAPSAASSDTFRTVAEIEMIEIAY